MIVYKTTNKINNKFYVGYDTNNNPQYLGSGKILKRAIEKYGKENFNKEILEECKDFKELCKKEIYWIDQLKPQYNIAKGGNGGWLGDEVNEKRKKSLTGRKFSDEHRLNLSKAHIGKKLKEGQHEKIVKSRQNNGKPWASESWKEKMREFMRGNDYGKNSKGHFQHKGEDSVRALTYEIKTPENKIIKIVSRTNLDVFAREMSKLQKRGNKFRSKELIDFGESKGYVLIRKYRQGK